MPESQKPSELANAVESHYQTRPPHATSSENTGWILQQPHTRAALQWIGKGRRVLDLGCHKGDLGAAVRDAGNDVLGVDFPTLAAEARERHGLETLAHDLADPLPLDDQAFDVVLAVSVLDYIPGDLAFLRECRRLLKTGGMFIAAVPNAASLFNRLAIVTGRVGRNYADPTGYHTLHTYTLGGIRTLLGVAGLTPVEHVKCPKVHTRMPLRRTLERLLPATFATDIAIKAVRA